jgi:hypothetical protein
VIIGTRAPTPWRTATTHARHQRALDSQCLLASVPKIRGSLIVKSGGFPAEFDEGDGLKNHRLASFSFHFLTNEMKERGECA